MKNHSQLGRTQDSMGPTFNVFQPESQSHVKLNNPGRCWHFPFPHNGKPHMFIISPRSSAQIHHHGSIYITLCISYKNN